MNDTSIETEQDDNISPYTRQEHAYQRLKVLYKASKIFSSFDRLDDDFEKTFPEILTLCATTFPFLTAIVMENKGDKLNTIVWNASNASEEQIHLAITNAKESFIYLTGANDSQSDDLRRTNVQSEQLKGIHIKPGADASKFLNYCVVPLLVERLPAFGILQLEGSLRLNENDLEFIGALADLVVISLDRHYKNKCEKESQKKEAKENTEKLTLSQTHVHDLESERDLRERFVSLLTHDLRTPLTVIKMNAQLIQRHKQDPKDVESYAASIDSSVNRTDQMISGLLDANRIRSGEKLPIKIEFFNLTQLVKKTLDDLTVVHGKRFVLRADQSIHGYWDKKGLRRIIENLCDNAIKYGFTNNRVEVIVTEKNHGVIIEVRNKGELISREDQKNLFEQFYRARNTTERGWGIGLTLVKGLSEAHGGSVKVESDIEMGTCFTVSLPLDSRAFILQ